MEKEFDNILELLRSQDPQNKKLGLQLIGNYEKEFRNRLGYEVEDFKAYVAIHEKLFGKSIYEGNEFNNFCSPWSPFRSEYMVVGIHNFELPMLINKITKATNIHKLTKLTFYGAERDGIPDEIGEFTNLEKLVVEKSRIKHISSEIGKLQNLKELELDDNLIDVLPPEIGNLRQLQKLSIKEHHLKNLPAEIGNLKKLTSLRIESQGLKEIPSEIGKLQNLTWLGITKTQIETLPSEIGNLKELDDLYLGYNSIKSLPSKIGKLKVLTRLDLNNNCLESLPPEIEQMENVYYLDVSNNKLKIFPQAITQMKSLSMLEVGGNPMKWIPSAMRKKNPAYTPDAGIFIKRNIEISKGSIVLLTKEFDEVIKLLTSGKTQGFSEALKQAQKHEKEFKAYTNFTVQEYKILADFLLFHQAWDMKGLLTDIQILDLSSKKLKNVEFLVCRMAHLTKLDLSGNDLEELSKDFRKLKNTQIDVSNNPHLKLEDSFKKMKNLIYDKK